MDENATYEGAKRYADDAADQPLEDGHWQQIIGQIDDKELPSKYLHSLRKANVTLRTLANLDLELFEKIHGEVDHPQQALAVIQVLNEWGSASMKGQCNRHAAKILT